MNKTIVLAEWLSSVISATIFEPSAEFIQWLNWSTKDKYAKFLWEKCQNIVIMDQNKKEYKIWPIDPKLYNMELFTVWKLKITFEYEDKNIKS